MRTYRATISPAQPYVINGAYRKFYLVSNAVGQLVTVRLYRGNQELEPAEDVEAGYWATPPGGFDRIQISTSAPGAVVWGVTDGDSGYDRVAQTISIQGAIQLDLATLIGSPVSVNVTNAATLLAGAVANRRSVRFLNTSAVPIYLGGSTVTANSPMVLNPGDYYDETDAAPAAWYGIAGTAGPHAVKVLAVTI